MLVVQIHISFPKKYVDRHNTIYYKRPSIFDSLLNAVVLRNETRNSNFSASRSTFWRKHVYICPIMSNELKYIERHYDLGLDISNVLCIQ